MRAGLEFPVRPRQSYLGAGWGPMSDELETAARYRVKEIKAKAGEMRNRGLRELMLGIAGDYERMARTLEDIGKARDG